MQRTKHGIPCNVSLGNRKKLNVRTAKTPKQVLPKYNHFAELSKVHKNAELIEYMLVPVGSEEYTQALNSGYIEVMQWKTEKYAY